MSGNSYHFTNNLKTVFDDRYAALKSYYCREDFECALWEYDHAPADARKWRENDLYDMCTARDIYITDLLADRSVLNEIPTRAQMKEELLQSFHAMYESAYSADDYMERNVRRLAPEYSADTVRVAILKKFILGGGEGFKRFKTKQCLKWAESRLSEEEAAAYVNAPAGEKTGLLLSKIDDSVFDTEGPEAEAVKLTDAEVLALIVKRNGMFVKDGSLEFDGIVLSEKSDRLWSKLAERFSLSADTAAQQIACASRAAADGMIPEGDPDFTEYVTAVESDFRAQLRTVPRMLQTGKPSNAAELFLQAKKDALKAKRAARKAKSSAVRLDSDLLKLCNDLAAGNFRTNGKTKQYLYYFAFMFGMTIPMEGRACPPERNLETNLFHDYYNDNLLRLLSGEYADPKTVTALDTEPTGEGVNYKSFAEVIYLYFLCRDDLNLTPGERIDKAESVIDRCITLAKNNGTPVQIDRSRHTLEYRERNFPVLLTKEPDEIPGYVKDNYLVWSPDNVGSARITVSSEENTAYDLIGEIFDDLDAGHGGIRVDLMDYSSKADRKSDISAQLDASFGWGLKQLLEERYSGDERFLKLLNALDERTSMEHTRFRKSDRERMLLVLRVLAGNPTDAEPLTAHVIKNRLEKQAVFSAGSQFSDAIHTLSDIGFDIRTDTQKSEERYFLGTRTYQNALLNDLLESVSGLSWSVDGSSDALLITAMVNELRAEKRITRSELLCVHLRYYVSLLDESEGLDSFPEVFEDYVSSANSYLEEARFQPISVKNLLDMYIVTALYFYLVDGME